MNMFMSISSVSLLTFSVVVACAWKVVNENPSDIISKG